ncbi:hypothetical protein F5Y19DRAFT_419675 [Xylariaceae sp. FL1651]|nr:hypothetical protein F5Y19DRAFT_419675 [Xylariaceae sp. FL1651]
MAWLLRRGTGSPPMEAGQPSIEGRTMPNDIPAKTFHIRAEATTNPTPTARPMVTTPYAVALTTTFMPPDSCNQDQFTMLSSPGYFIWLNEPVPVSGTTVSDCYPSEFLEYYTTYHVNPTTVGSRVPLMSPLVCPLGWQAVLQVNDYQACCPSGYLLTPPETTLDPNRPAYGGTCYSQWPLSSRTTVAVYGPSSFSGSSVIEASTTGFANYAHVIDGITVATSSLTSSAAHSSSASDSAKTAVSGHAALPTGAIVGIVVALVVAVGLLAIGGYIFVRRRRRSALPPLPPPKDEVGTSALSPSTVSDFNSIAMRRAGTDISEMGPGEFRIHELDVGLPQHNDQEQGTHSRQGTSD